jgi:hypothetical protein
VVAKNVYAALLPERIFVAQPFMDLGAPSQAQIILLALS